MKIVLKKMSKMSKTIFLQHFKYDQDLGGRTFVNTDKKKKTYFAV